MTENSTTELEVAVVSRGEADRYGSYYYEHCCGLPYDRSVEWLGLFSRFADRITSEIHPESVLDAGCAMGLLVEALHERGVDAYGIDISDFAIDKVHESVKDRCRVGSILEPFGRRYSLIVTIEVLEHLRPSDAEAAVENLCKHADDILFSSTPFDYNEATHFNVQPPEYWAVLFARHGFTRDLDYDASFITRWATRFRRTEMTPWRLVLGYERKVWRLMQENLGARESLVNHQDQLMRTEGELVNIRAELAALEPTHRLLESQLHSSRSTEALLKAEIQRVFNEGQRIVTEYQNHVKMLDARIEVLNSEIEKGWARAAASEKALLDERAARDAHERHLLSQHQVVARELEQLRSGRAWRILSAVSRWMRRILSWRPGQETRSEAGPRALTHRPTSMPGRPMSSPRSEIHI